MQIRILATLMFFLVLLAGCKKEPACQADDGDEVHCYFDPPERDFDEKIDFATFCKKTSVPPCDCRDSNLNLRDVGAIFDQPCNGCIIPGCVGGPESGGLVADPLEFYCVSGFNDICPQFDTYYIDASPEGDDQYHRPVFFNFLIQGYDIQNFNYRFTIRRVGETAIVFDRLLTYQYMSVLKNAQPEDGCLGAVCDFNGVISMHLWAVKTPGEYEISMQSEHKESGQITSIAADQFRIETTDGGKTRRTMDIKFYKTRTYDISSYFYKHTFEQTVISVFGSQKCNIDFNFSSEILGSPYVDRDDNIMLNEADMSGAGAENDITDALIEWSKRVYSKTFGTQTNKAVGLETWLMEKFDFSAGSPVASDPFFFSTAAAFMTAQGYNFSTKSTGYFNVGVVLRMNNVYSKLTEAEKARVDEKGLAVSTMMHEMGHMWSNAGMDFGQTNQCDQHANYCGGRGKFECLWQTACVGRSGTSNPYSRIDYFVQRLSQPRYCENHQQYFMNRLRASD